jgi:hypothetical protein
MKRSLATLWLLLGLMLLVHPSAAQSVAIPITIPIDGQLVMPGNLAGALVDSGSGDNQLLLLDTYSGSLDVLLQSDVAARSPIWSPDGNTIAFLNFLSVPTVSLYDLSTGSMANILTTPGTLSYPQTWSPDGSQVLSVGYSRSNGVGQYQLQRINVDDGAITPLFTYTMDKPIYDVPLPPEATVFNLYNVRQARWNPVYPEWVLIQLDGYDPDFLDPFAGYPSMLYSTFLYNLQTAEKLSLDELFSARMSFLPIQWSADGRHLVLSTSEALGTTATVSFQQVNGVWTLDVIESVRTLDDAVIDWLGVSDLLLTSAADPSDDDVFHIAQIIDGEWYSTEFFRLPDAAFQRAGDEDWHITASEQEKQSLTCLFDQAVPTQLDIGTRARVNFTTGTPLRLRVAPSVEAAEIQQMPEGTEFTIIDGPACDNADSYYRFWQVQLDDGAVGWAAESTNTDTFIEPVPPSPTPG